MSQSAFQRHRSASPDLLKDSCPECNGSLVTECAETRCQECGVVVDDLQIDRGPEWRFFEDGEGEDQGRTGAALTVARHDRGLSTTIGSGYDAKGNSLSSQKRRQLSRLRREHARAQAASKADRNLRTGLGEIARIVSALGLSRSAREQASQLFRTAQSEDLLVGRSLEGVAAACVYAVCRLTGLSRSLDEIVAVARREWGQVANCYNAMNRGLDLPTPPRRPQEFVANVASSIDLAISMNTERQAREIADEATAVGIADGRDPVGFAAACLEIALDDTSPVTQEMLADAADVHARTVREGRQATQAALDWCRS